MLSSGRVQDKDKIIDYYRILEKESARLQRLVEDLLDFRRMESNARPYRPESFPVEGLIEEISASFSEEHGLDAAALQTHVEGNAMVYLDRESLTRAIWNLLDNSVKYSKGKPRIALSSSVRGSNVQIEVKDQGVGIEMEDQSRIFNKFVRGDAAKITNAKGTGLGLAMVRKVLEDQGGSIHVQSTPGGGSTFTMVLELAGKI
jgi:two-component system phosphate regulon sensor histidine kinase PhoR